MDTPEDIFFSQSHNVTDVNLNAQQNVYDMDSIIYWQ